MKLLFLTSFIILSICLSANAQGLGGLIKNATKKDSTGKVTAGSVFNGQKMTLSNEDIIRGLKEALQVGAQRSTSKLSSVDGFFKDAALKILMPAEAQKVEKTLRGLGMNRQVDNAILSMNRAAEDAAKDAVPIFVNAIKGMSFQDALQILKGGDYAATDYLKGKTILSLADAFRPVIENSLKKVNATKYWDAVFTSYNKFSTEKVNTDLVQYVTEKALTGIFLQLGTEEQKIRKDPGARTSEILRKVFSN